jgi:putative DNA primase/helicase
MTNNPITTTTTTVSAAEVFDQVPAELKARSQWVAWDYATFPGDKKPRKLPISPSSGRPAKTTDPSTWGTFEDALARHDEDGLSGLGFVFTAGDEYCGIDLDNVVLATDPPHIKSEAAEIVNQIDSYTELSPSGTGVHIIAKGRLSGRGRKRGGIEIYDRERYFTMTGKVIRDVCKPIPERQDAVNELYESLSPPKRRAHLSAEARQRRGPELTDQLVIESIFASPYRAMFLILFCGGNWKRRFSSQSEADLALVGLLATFVGANPTQIDRLFRSSALFRPKWDEQRGSETYGERTINKVLEIL